VEDVLKEGQEVEVKIIDIDTRTGKIKLSRKELLPRPPRPEPEKRDPEQSKNN
jgi:polyribonucleotide nucleotidyltransferase